MSQPCPSAALNIDGDHVDDRTICNIKNISNLYVCVFIQNLPLEAVDVILNYFISACLHSPKHKILISIYLILSIHSRVYANSTVGRGKQDRKNVIKRNFHSVYRILTLPRGDSILKCDIVTG